MRQRCCQKNNLGIIRTGDSGREPHVRNYALPLGHHVAVDRATGQADSRLMSLGRAIKDALDQRPQSWLGEQLGVDPAQVSRIISGKLEVTTERLADIERALGVTPGTIFRAAGYVADNPTVIDAIVADKALTPEQKRTLRNVYELAISSRRQGRQRS